MNITRSRVREAIARAERHNPHATELSNGRAVVSEGDLHVLVEAAKCAIFKDMPLGDAVLDTSAADQFSEMKEELKDARSTIKKIRDLV